MKKNAALSSLTWFIQSPKRLAIGSIGVGCVVLGLKWVAYLLTGSVALYSDALESIINVAAACAALVAVHVSAQPADENHPYGHHKAEYFSAVLEGSLILLAALAIANEALSALLHGRDFHLTLSGVAVTVLASLINAGWAKVLLLRGKKLGSAAMVADGKHIWSDVVSSIGVLVGVGLAAATGWHALDPLLALAVAVNILWSGWHLVKESIGGLMDEAAPPEVVKVIETVLQTAAPEAIEAHGLRTRRASKFVFIDFHLVVPGTMTVRTSHAVCDKLETALSEALAAHHLEAHTTIHVEPEDQAEKTAS